MKFQLRYQESHSEREISDNNDKRPTEGGGVLVDLFVGCPSGEHTKAVSLIRFLKVMMRRTSQF